jgi:hypothetical protein
VALPLLIAAADEDRQELQDLWARLLGLIFHPILNPFVNNLPFVANRTEIEKVRAIDGRLPHGMSVARLTDLPAEWSRQREMLGFPSH